MADKFPRPITERPRSRVPSIAGERLESAGIRAADAHRSVRRHANRITDELDEITPPLGIPKVELSDEDSMVIAVDAVIAANQK